MMSSNQISETVNVKNNKQVVMISACRMCIKNKTRYSQNTRGLRGGKIYDSSYIQQPKRCIKLRAIGKEELTAAKWIQYSKVSSSSLNAERQWNKTVLDNRRLLILSE